MKSFFLLSIFALSFTLANAQGTAKEGSPATNTLSRQFNNLKGNANSYQENNKTYKVVAVTSLDAFWKSVQDTIKAREVALIKAGKSTEEALTQAKDSIQKQNNQLQEIKQQYAVKEQEVQQSAHNVANLSVLGLDMEKQHYVFLSFGVIITLLLVLGIIMMQFRSSKQTAVVKQRAFDEIDQEYSEFKKNAREKELKVKRELQTEMNRIEELNQQIIALKKQTHNS
ncbi:hypothetical protein MKJ04_09445 [Pontibacter sp. E15-1]|uniref:hypothetical protein n=1 Tax=Pontibacter sp. E15-1 TaxID=2919918 RepID=UPI001F501EBB|nr:hypothetical protein [Pontibacter sp. E15-1]MCJ8165067.1 hypothetical protein [Pontibacter sp. E15-1]